jgi:uncharacterized membrane protein
VSGYLARTILLSAASGLRSSSAPAFLARAASRGDLSLPESPPLQTLRSPLAAALLAAALAGEMVVDKLPFVPDRISPPALAGRMVSGTLAGSLLFREAGRRAWAGALLGAAVAAASAHAGYRLRGHATGRLGLPDLPVALAEDAAVLACGAAFLRQRG